MTPQLLILIITLCTHLLSTQIHDLAAVYTVADYLAWRQGLGLVLDIVGSLINLKLIAFKSVEFQDTVIRTTPGELHTCKVSISCKKKWKSYSCNQVKEDNNSFKFFLLIQYPQVAPILSTTKGG